MAGPDKTYRRTLSHQSGRNRRLVKFIWHCEATCPQWPQAGFIEHSEPPGYGMLCADCTALGSANQASGEFSFFTVPGEGIDSARVLWKWQRGQETCMERCISLTVCMEKAEKFGFHR